MASLPTEMLRARLAISRAAVRRWQERTAARESAGAAIRSNGPGAGDSPDQVAKYNARETLRFTERMIGRSWDATPFAPSERAREVARPVARLVTLPGEGYLPEGFATGFLVTPRLLLTNHHVFPRSGSAVNCGANFLFEETERGTSSGVYFALDPQTFYFSDAVLDFALVAVSPKGTQGESIQDFGTIPLIASTGKILKGKPINIIQHPNGGQRQYAVKNNSLVDILDEGFIHYETDTAPGTSGAPAFNEHWELVGLHHCGIPAIANGVPIKEDGTPWDSENESEDKIRWLANEGSRVSFIVDQLSNAKAVEGERALLEELLAQTRSRQVADESTIPSIGSPPGTFGTEIPISPSRTMSNVIFNISGPVTIHITSSPVKEFPVVKAAVDAGKPESALVTVKAVEVKQTFDPHYSDRIGYDPEFLGITVAAPRVKGSRKGEIYNVGDYKQFAATSRLVPKIATDGLDGLEPITLDYYHYSLVFNKTYRMAMWTASNADYREEMRQDPRNRGEFGGEDWRSDPRVPNALQLLNNDIYGPATNLDRGHLVRREDSCWGAPGEETAFSNADTYHWTNCTPQHELFNQEHPKGAEYKGLVGIWGLFEGDLQEEISSGGGQVTLFSGPILSDECPTKDFGRGPVRYPLRFWKVAVIAESSGDNPKLKAYGFILDQSDAIKEFGLGWDEALVLAKFKGMREKLSVIEGLAGIEFDPVLLAADQKK